MQLGKNAKAGAVIQIQDLSGRTLKTQSAGTAEKVRVNTSDLSNGLYNMVIRSSEGVAVKKITVAR